MSLLLDALNKADQERKRSEAIPGIDSNHESYAPQSHGISPSLLVAIVFGVALIVGLAVFFWLGQRPQPVATPTPVASTSTPAKQTAASSTEPLITPTSPSQASQASQELSAPTEEVAPDDSVANLYQQNEAPISAPAPADEAPTSHPLITPNGSGQSINQFANIPDINELPQNVLGKIPSLNYSQHNFNSVGGSVVINGVIRRPNEQVANGIVLEKILEDGIILHVDTFSFKMRALNSWLNM